MFCHHQCQDGPSRLYHECHEKNNVPYSSGRDITVADALGSKPITITYTTDEGKVMRASVR